MVNITLKDINEILNAELKKCIAGKTHSILFLLEQDDPMPIKYIKNWKENHLNESEIYFEEVCCGSCNTISYLKKRQKEKIKDTKLLIYSFVPMINMGEHLVFNESNYNLFDEVYFIKFDMKESGEAFIQGTKELIKRR